MKIDSAHASVIGALRGFCCGFLPITRRWHGGRLRGGGLPRDMVPRVPRVLLLAATLTLAATTVGGCGGRSASASVSAQRERAALVSYLRQGEPIRRAATRPL